MTDPRDLAAEMLEHERWFMSLDPSMKDALSLPNYEHQQYAAGMRLARLMAEDIDGPTDG